MISLSVKRAIIPHICSCSTSKEAWDTLVTLYQARNEARVAYLCKQLESEQMNEGESMEFFLTKIKDLKEQLIAIDEILIDSSLVQTILNGLPDSYQSFASTLCLMMKGNPNALSFEELVFVCCKKTSLGKIETNSSNNKAFGLPFIIKQRVEAKL